jgi:hypothetical protein
MQPPLSPANGTDNGTVIGALGIEIGAADDLLTAAELVLPPPSHGRANRTTIFRLRRSKRGFRGPSALCWAFGSMIRKVPKRSAKNQSEQQ